MVTYENQKVIKVCKANADADNVYGIINRKAAELAAHELSSGARLLWMYLAMNQDGYTFALSQKAIERDWNIKRRQYHNAVQELVEKGYLVQQKGNCFDFVEMVCP